MAIIEKLWIFSQNGVPIADFNEGEKTDNSLLTSLMSAIHTFTENISGKKLKAFQTGEHRYTCVKCLKDNIIIIIQSTKESKQKTIIKTCDILKEIFEKMFTVDQIEKWDGDLSLFNKYKEKVDLYFKLRDM